MKRISFALFVATFFLVACSGSSHSGNSGGSGSPTQPSPTTPPSSSQPTCQTISGNGTMCLAPVDASTLGARIPVVLIHGWNNTQPGKPSPEIWTNFLAYASGISWVGEKFKFYQLTYYSNLVSVSDLGKDFATVVNAMDSKDSAFASKQIFLIGHSMGGLVARAFMQEARLANGQAGADRVSRLVTLATPHHGTPVANGPSRDDKAGALISFVINWFDDNFFGGVIWSAYNRFDLHDDGYITGMLDYKRFPQDENVWLAGLNNRNIYWNKFSVYGGLISPSENFNRCVGLDFGCLSLLVDDIFTTQNDGVVPRYSALAGPCPNCVNDEPLPGFDHLQMVEGRSGSDSYLFGAILGDLSDFVYAADSRFGSSVTLGATGEEFHNLRGWGAAGQDQIGTYRIQTTGQMNSVDLFVADLGQLYALSFQRRDGGCNSHFETYIYINGADVPLEPFMDPSFVVRCSASQGVSSYRWSIPAVYIKNHRLPVEFLDMVGDGSGAAPTYNVRLDRQ